ncbi:sensor histidine kinase [Marinitenerispora sediminis]|uniref:sensor histidine kinase n=1 Tax=Marinitenerispora sediminis TaxID=1931232 RepID=UPI001F396438|nr:histidine kinase [Marinitenerispora sediminis]
MRDDELTTGGTFALAPGPAAAVRSAPRIPLAQLARAWGLAAVGAVLGAALAVVEIGFVLLLGAGALVLSPLAFWRPARRLLGRAAARSTAALVAVERARLAACFDRQIAGRPGTVRSLGYLAARWPVGIFGGFVLAVFPGGLYLAVSPLNVLDGNDPAIIVVGVVFMYLSVQGTVGLVGMERALARWLLGPSRQDLLEQRVAELTESRAGVVAAVDDERRRIERDLHDGVQQRLVALAMLLGRLRRGTDPRRGADLLQQAHDEAQQALTELREVAWRVYPATLDELGLETALRGVAERSGIPVSVDCRLAERPARQVETAVYFVVREAVTNAAKHSGAEVISVRVTQEPGAAAIGVRIEDDGVGGADPRGGGLSGLARRVAALDGRFRVHSPPGGPTEITAELPARPE